MILTKDGEKRLLRKFAEWLEKCAGKSVTVRVRGYEGGHPFDREVSITDAVADFMEEP